jgi:hypothetical protein
MHPADRHARVAGLVYLALAVTAPMALLVLPGRMRVPGDPTATLARIAADPMLLQLQMAAELLVGLLSVATAVALYRLFAPVARDVAQLLVLLGGVIPAVLYFANAVPLGAILALATHAQDVAGLADAERVAHSATLFVMHRYGIVVNEVFWGVWLFPFGWLVRRSGYFPRILAWLLYVNGAAYLAIAATEVLWPTRAQTISRALTPALMGELAVMLWFLAAGARGARTAAPTAA